MAEKKPDPRTTEQREHISRVELELQSRLSPVQPDPEFIRHLHSRLTNPSTMDLEPDTPFLNLFIALGISAGGILILVGVLRLVYEILKAVGIIRAGK